MREHTGAEGTFTGADLEGDEITDLGYPLTDRRLCKGTDEAAEHFKQENHRATQAENQSERCHQ